jgi:diguanylate cyclase (GGDEF)-like protein/PAS domain S-box-containing protein
MQVQTSKMPLAVMPDATLELDADGRIVAANDLALEMFGYAADELDGQPGAHLLPIDELFAHAGAARCVKLVGRRANGTPFPLEATLRRIDDAGVERALCAVRELDDDALVGEAQRYFDVAFDNAPIGMALFNCDGEYVRVNAALCELLGRPEHELIGRRDQELTHPDDRQADLDAAWAILEGAYSTHQCEKRFVRPDGSIVWALANLTFLRDDGGRPLSWVGQFQDITARRAAEEALRTSEERHRLVVRNLPGAAVVLYDLELRCVLIEGRQVDDAGVVATEVVGRSMREIVPPELLPVLEPAARRALEGEASQLEMSSPRAGRVLRAEVVPHHDAHGRIAGVLVAVRDVTEQRAAERATRDAEERFRLAFDHAPIGIALVAPDGRWLRVNRRLCEMTGYAEDELLSRTFQDITHPDDMDADLEHVRAMLAGEIRTYEMEKRYFRADGSVIWILLAVSLVCDDQDRPLYFISQIQDIDERRRAQGELERLAHRDALTGIPNRRAWEVALERAVHDARHTGRPLAVAVIDLNDFKAVNDSHGHDAGDRLLERAAAAWQGQLRGSDLLARIGGDEFAVLLPDCAGGDVDAVVRRLRGALAHPAGCAIGVALWAGDTPSELMRRADEALYADKRPLADGRPASAARG